MDLPVFMQCRHFLHTNSEIIKIWCKSYLSWLTFNQDNLNHIISLAGRAPHISWSNAVCLCVCLDVNEGGTDHNCCTQRLVVLCVQTH